jgi:hypothetical protein
VADILKGFAGPTNQVETISTSGDKDSQNATTIYFLYEIKNKMLEIKIDDIIPDTLSYSYSPNYSGQNTLGRMSPIQIYSGGSARVYSFSLLVHEDMIETSTNFGNITDFVDAIKTLSYPFVNSLGETVKPSVEFYIGKISGKGIVTTDISWKKPFRNGRYIVAEISFSITVEKINPVPNLRTETTKEYVEGNLVYNDKIIVSEDVTDLLNNNVFEELDYYEYYEYDYYKVLGNLDIENITLSNLLTVRNTTNAERINNAIFLRDYFDMSRDIFSSILGVAETSTEESLNLRSSIGRLDAIYYDLNNYIDSYSKDPLESFSSVKESLDLLEDRFIDYLDYYYENVDKDMTRDEYNKVKDEVIIIIDNMRDMYEAVRKYAEVS